MTKESGIIFSITCDGLDSASQCLLEAPHTMTKQEFLDLVETVKERQWLQITKTEDLASGSDLFERIIETLQLSKYGFKKVVPIAEYFFNEFDYWHDKDEVKDGANRR